MIRWRKVDDDRIRSDCWCYWVVRDRVMGVEVFTAMYRPQDVRLDGQRLGEYRSGADAKAACNAHAQPMAAAA